MTEMQKVVLCLLAQGPRTIGEIDELVVTKQASTVVSSLVERKLVTVDEANICRLTETAKRKIAANPREFARELNVPMGLGKPYCGAWRDHWSGLVHWRRFFAKDDADAVISARIMCQPVGLELVQVTDLAGNSLYRRNTSAGGRRRIAAAGSRCGHQAGSAGNSSPAPRRTGAPDAGSPHLSSLEDG